MPVGRHRVHAIAVMNESPPPMYQMLLHERFVAFKRGLVESWIQFLGPSDRFAAGVLTDLHAQIIYFRKPIKAVAVVLLKQETGKLIFKLVIDAIDLEPMLLFLNDLQSKIQIWQQLRSNA